MCIKVINSYQYITSGMRQTRCQREQKNRHHSVVKGYTFKQQPACHSQPDILQYNNSAFDVTVGGENKLSLRYAYDGESKLASVTDEKGNQVVGYTYDKDGNLSERKVPECFLSTVRSI